MWNPRSSVAPAEPSAQAPALPRSAVSTWAQGLEALGSDPACQSIWLLSASQLTTRRNISRFPAQLEGIPSSPRQTEIDTATVQGQVQRLPA